MDQSKAACLPAPLWKCQAETTPVFVAVQTTAIAIPVGAVIPAAVILARVVVLGADATSLIVDA